MTLFFPNEGDSDEGAVAVQDPPRVGVQPFKLPEDIQSLEAAILRIGNGEGSREDYDLALASHLRDTALDDEIQRLKRVDKLRTEAGSPAKLEAMKQKAEQDEVRIAEERSKLQAEVDKIEERKRELTGQISALDREVSGARKTIERMIVVNDQLRDLAPENVRRFVVAVIRGLTEKLGPPMKQAQCRAQSLQWMASQELPKHSAEERSANLHFEREFSVRLDELFTRFEAMREDMGLNIEPIGREEFATRFDAIKARCKQALPEAVQESLRLESEFKAAKEEARAQLDVYLPD